MNYKLDPQMQLGYTKIRVQDFSKQKAFYSKLGFTIIEETNDLVKFGVDGRTILILTTEDGVIPRPARTTGLFHFAILVPSREDLGHVIANLSNESIQFTGAGDHIYSEAFYLNDPEGNGIEIYHDRPKSSYVIDEQGMVQTDTLPVDVQSILALHDPNRAWEGFPTGTILGHMHLNVSDLNDEVAKLYFDALGFDLKTNFRGSAWFISAGGYHHHIAMNLWNGRGIPNAPKIATGLVSFSLNISSIEELEKLTANLQKHDVSYEQVGEKVIVEDINQNEMIFEVQQLTTY